MLGFVEIAKWFTYSSKTKHCLPQTAYTFIESDTAKNGIITPSTYVDLYAASAYDRWSSIWWLCSIHWNPIKHHNKPNKWVASTEQHRACVKIHSKCVWWRLLSHLLNDIKCLKEFPSIRRIWSVNRPLRVVRCVVSSSIKVVGLCRLPNDDDYAFNKVLNIPIQFVARCSMAFMFK